MYSKKSNKKLKIKGDRNMIRKFEKVKEEIEEIEEINPENLTVFMESTGTYHLPVERYFKENGFNTLVINSLTTKNNFDTIRKTKTDKKDCYRLAKLFFVNEVEYHEISKKDLYANLKAMTRQYFYLTLEKKELMLYIIIYAK